MHRLKSIIDPVIFFLLSGLTCASANAQDDQLRLDPEVAKLIKQTPMKESYKEAGAVILLKEDKCVVKRDGLTENTVHVVGKILDSKAKADYNQIVISYNSYYEDITLDYARTIKEDGSTQEVSKDAVQIKTPQESGDRTYTDQRQLTFSFPSLTVGSAFEFQFSVKQKLPVIPGEWITGFSFQYAQRNRGSYPAMRIDPVHQSRYSLRVQEEKEFQHHLNNIDISPTVTKGAGYVQFSWEAEELPAITYEEGMPNIYGLMPQIDVTSLKGWNQIDTWAAKRFLSRIEITPEIRAKAEELTRNASTMDEKIKAIYSFMQTHIDYIEADLGRGGYTPHYAGEILRNLYGDCKDKATLFISLLKSAGIPAYPALINPSPYKKIDKDIPTSYFVHLIVYIPTAQKEYWLDATSDVTPFPNLYFPDQDRWAFVIDGKGGEFRKTPLAEPEENMGASKVISFIEGTHYKNRVTLNAKGSFSDILKFPLKRIKSDEREKSYRKYLESLSNSKKIDSIAVSDPDKPGENFQLFFQTDEPDLLNSSLLYFTYEGNAKFPFSYFTGLQSLPSPEERKHDYIFGCRYKISNTESYFPPTREFKVLDLPESDSIETEYVSFNRRFSEQNDTVKANWELTLKQPEIPQEDYQGFYDSIQKIIDGLPWEVEFSRATQSTSALEGKQEENQKNKIRLSVMVVKTRGEAQEILEKLHGGEDFASLANKFSIGPGKENGGDIGYVSADDLMEELRAVADTLSVDHYSRIIETTSGYFIIKKTAENIVASSGASESFSSYLEKGKAAYKNEDYSKAIEYLEKAVELDSQNQETHYFLGCAYDRSASPEGDSLTETRRGLTEKASMHFQKVIEISPSYEGELSILHPYDKLTSIWASLAMAYAYHGKVDSARWAFEQGQKSGGFYPAIVEYNRNTMASCEENAILLTNGDNDTFPMWYLQFIEGYRKDINVVNLSLLNTPWYIKMLKSNDPFGRNTIPLDLTAEGIDSLNVKYWPEQKYAVPVQNDAMNLRGKIQWTLKPTLADLYLRIQDQVLLKIMESNQWQRPIYFSTTVSQVNQMGLHDYLRCDGLALKLMSHKVTELPIRRLSQNCLETYTFDAIADNHVRVNPGLAELLQNYRAAFAQLANYYLTSNDTARFNETVDRIYEVMPVEVVPYSNPVIEQHLETYALIAGVRSIKDLENKGHSASTMKDIGQLALRLGKLNIAKTIFEQLMTTDPANAHYYLGICYRRLEQYDEAVNNHLKAIELDPDNPVFHNALGYTYMKMGLYDESIAAYNRSLELNPNYESSYGNMGWVYYLKEDFQKCIEFSEKAVALEPTAFYARYNICISNLCLGNVEEAKELYKKTREYDLSINNKVRPGAIKDLKDLIEQNIMPDQTRMILRDVFGLNDDEIDNN